jgi:hypothetical protein
MCNEIGNVKKSINWWISLIINIKQHAGKFFRLELDVQFQRKKKIRIIVRIWIEINESQIFWSIR